MQIEPSTVPDTSERHSSGVISPHKGVVSMDMNCAVRESRPQVMDDSAVHLPNYKFNSVKMISIEESIKLVDEQRKKQEVGLKKLIFIANFCGIIL